MKKYTTILLFMGIGFLLSMAMLVYDKFTYFEPMDKTQIDAHRIGASATLDEKLRKEGCYEVGVSSYESLFTIGRAIDGQYKLQIYHDNELIEEKVIDKPLAIGAHSRTDYTNALLHVFAVPLKGYGKLTFKLTVLKPDSMIKDGSKQIYFYVNKSDYICGQAQASFDKQKQVDNLTIDTNETNETLLPLSKALWKSDTSKVKQLIEKSLSVNIKMVADHTPLHYAAYFNDTQTARYLIDHGANIDAMDIQGHTPLYYAIEHNGTKTVKLLLDKGADPRKVRFLSPSDMSVNIFDPKPRPQGDPALFYAACNEYSEITELLLQSDKVDKHEMYFGWNAYRHLNECIRNKYKITDTPTLDDQNRYNYIKNKHIKTMYALLEKYGLKFEVENSTVQFDEPKEN